MKTVLRFLFQALCLLLVAAGLLAALIASFCLLAMMIVWFQEGALQMADRKMLAGGAKWLLGSCVLLGAAWWIRCKMAVSKTGDNSFRLVESKSGRLEKLVQNTFGITIVSILAFWFWTLIPGNPIIRILMVAGWLTAGFLGLHARILLHEVGHLTAARFLGLELRKIQVGVGPLLWSRSFAHGLLCEWRASPQGGFVFAADRWSKGFRARQSLLAVAGPLVDLLILWLAYQSIVRSWGGLGAAFGRDACGLLVFTLFWLTALSAVGGLIPHKIWIGPYKMCTDGYCLLRLLIVSREVAELEFNSNYRELLELLRSDFVQPATPPEAMETESPLTKSLAFHEQQARLSSRLLRPASSTSGPRAWL